MPGIDIVAAATQESSDTWLVYVLFIVAGLLAGGTWSAYQAGSRALTIFVALCAAVAFAGAVFFLIGAMN